MKLLMLSKISLAAGNDATIRTLVGLHFLRGPSLRYMPTLDVNFQVRILVSTDVVAERTFHFLFLSKDKLLKPQSPNES